MARMLGTEHHVVEAGPAEIAESFPAVVWHAEMPLVRTAPVPLYLLARDVHAHGMKVVITGEGADELFWGYDLFKEVSLRELHRSDPALALRLIEGLYPHLGPAGARRGPAWRRFLLETGSSDDPLSSHLTRAAATGTVRALYRPEIAAEIGDGASLERLRAELPTGFDRWSSLDRAGWLELKTLLEPYLLAAQGDRVAMAHGVEGRFPFLDHHVFAHAARLPSERKLSGLTTRSHSVSLPPACCRRESPPARSSRTGRRRWNPSSPQGHPTGSRSISLLAHWPRLGSGTRGRVAGLLRRCRAGRATGVREGMALVGVLSTQLWHSAFCDGGLRKLSGRDGRAPRES